MDDLDLKQRVAMNFACALVANPKLRPRWEVVTEAFALATVFIEFCETGELPSAPSISPRKTPPTRNGEQPLVPEPEADDLPLCPSCGGPMIERTSKYGDFYGCQAFPECRGVRNPDGTIRGARS